MEDTSKKPLRSCAFCGRTEREVAFLIPAMDGKTYICDNCIDLCSDFIEKHMESLEAESVDETLTFETLPRPKEIKEMLDGHVIGQEDAKLALSVAVYNHYKRILSLEKEEKKSMTDGINIKEVMPMLSGFTVLRMTNMVGMVGISFTKEELLKMNKKLNKIRKPKNKKK